MYSPKHNVPYYSSASRNVTTLPFVYCFSLNFNESDRELYNLFKMVLSFNHLINKTHFLSALTHNSDALVKRQRLKL